MKVRSPNIIGQFLLEGDGEGHRKTVHDVTFVFEWRPDGLEPWAPESITVPAGFRYDGSSRPTIVGWFVPRWGFSSEASCIHDFCFGNRPALRSGALISRKLTDEVFLAFLKWRAGSATDERRKIKVSEVMFKAVRWFGEIVWDRHDKEFRK